MLQHLRLSRRRVVLIAVCGFAMVLVAAAIGGWGYLRSIDNEVHRTNVFVPAPKVSRPPAAANEALNILIMGADSGDANEAVGGSRADTIILAHLPSDRRSAQFISIPRDTWLPIPEDGQGNGGEEAKINAAFAWGQAPLMVQTVEAFTGVRIDHTITVDFNGFQKIIDALGGIDINVDSTFTSSLPPYRTFTAGVNHMDGTVALDYARQRKQFADGDFARMRHQRDIVAAVFDSASELSILDGPTKLDSVIRSTAAAVTLDESLSIFDMVGMMRDIKKADLSMLTSPSAGTGTMRDQSVVFADFPAAKELYEAVRNDKMDFWLARHPAT